MAQLDHVAIEIRTDDPLASSIKKKLDKLPLEAVTLSREFTIFRVPSYIRESHKNFYEPRMVSIGPYHRGREHLKCMEEQKLRYVQKMLDENTDVTLNDYLKVVREREPTARRCYYEKIDMDSEEFVEMLLFDACFIIELAVSWSFPDEDIVHNISWNVPLIKSDLLMLENQIPFFVLESVFELYSRRDDGANNFSPFDDDDSTSQGSELEKASLFDVLVDFLEHGSETFSVPERDNRYDHLLDFYYQCYMRTQEFPVKPRRNFLRLEIFRPQKVFPLFSSIKRLTMRRRLHMIATRKPRMIPCATELKEAGITFKKAESKSIFNVHFSKGVLRIPYTSVEESTRPQIMNLIAFEQCSGQKNKPLTSYAVFMDCIVNTPKDVLILQQYGIIENKLADEKAAAVFFNQLRYCSYLDYEDHHLAELFENVKKYCESRWQRYRANLYRDYFSSPWLIISFFAGIILLLFSFVQALYSVFSYYK